MSSHSERTTNGVSWNLLRMLIQTVLGFGVGIALARMLPPEAFGLVATATVFMGLAEILGSLGMGAAVIQRPDLTAQQSRTAATLSLLMGVVLTALVLISAPILARMFNSAEVAPVLQVMSLTLLITSLGAVPKGLLMKQLEFKTLFIVDLISYLVGYAGVTIGLALNGFGVWSLVVGALASVTLSSLLCLFYQPLLPHWRCQLQDIKDFLHSGGGISLNSLINYAAANVDYLMIGKFQGQYALGLYSRAYHLVTLPLNKVATTLTSVMFPAYAEIQAHPHRVKNIYLRLIDIISLLLFPMMACFVVFADEVILGLYGSNWLGAVGAFRILALAGAFKIIFHLAGPLVQATGHVYREVRQQVVYLLILAVGCFVAAPYGVELVAWVVVVASVWLYLAMARLALSIVAGTWREFYVAQLPGIWVALIVIAIDSMVMALLPSNWAYEWRLLVLVISSGLAWVGAALYLPAPLIGQAPAWLISKFAGRLPASLGDWLRHRRPLNSHTPADIKSGA